MNLFQGRAVVFATLFVTATFPSQAQVEQGASILNNQLSSFSHRGTFEELLSELALELRPAGVIGLESDQSQGPELFLSIDRRTSVREVLNSLCAHDQRYRFIATRDPRVINVRLRNRGTLSTLLDTRLSKFDMRIEAWPMNWYSYIPKTSIEVQRVLRKYYTQHGGEREDSGAGTNLETNIQPPSVELHLKNVTVLEVLNLLAAKELDWASKENASVSKSGISYPVFPCGWEAQVAPPQNLSFGIWANTVLGPFPPSNRGHQK